MHYLTLLLFIFLAALLLINVSTARRAVYRRNSRHLRRLSR
uniref:Uncharacterized protein n=1 Tax=Ascaris lumbricoides TaxID=6252 RepID=A0A9J2PWN0_ASCLU